MEDAYALSIRLYFFYMQMPKNRCSAEFTVIKEGHGRQIPTKPTKWLFFPFRLGIDSNLPWRTWLDCRDHARLAATIRDVMRKEPGASSSKAVLTI
jgi:hypothetical protein